MRITITTSRIARLAGIILRFAGSTMRVAVMDSDDAVIFKLINGYWYGETGEKVEIHFRAVTSDDSMPLECAMEAAEAARAVGKREWAYCA